MERVTDPTATGFVGSGVRARRPIAPLATRFPPTGAVSTVTRAQAQAVLRAKSDRNRRRQARVRRLGVLTVLAGLAAGAGTGAVWDMFAGSLAAASVAGSGDTDGVGLARTGRDTSRGTLRTPFPSLSAVPQLAADSLDSAGTLNGAGTFSGAARTSAVDPKSGLTGTTVARSLGGRLDVVPGEAAAPAPAAGAVRRVRIEVEHGLPVDPQTIAGIIMGTLNDRRGWSGVDHVTFARTAGEADLRVVLASPGTTDRMCAPLDTGSTYSCGRNGAAVLNFERWVKGGPNFSDLVVYREYLVSHEVGHLLGHRHRRCGPTDTPASVMVQQSGARIRCVPNPWPNPTA